MKFLNRAFLVAATTICLTGCNNNKEDPFKLDRITVMDEVTEYGVGDAFIKPTVRAWYKDAANASVKYKDVTSKAKFSGFDSSRAYSQITIDVSYTENKKTVNTSYYVSVYGDVKKTTLKYSYENYGGRNYWGSEVCPSTGDVNLLVIPVWFTDSNKYIISTKKESVREDIEIAYFGTEEETGWHSVKTYYEAESHGALRLNGTVSEWYECKNSSKDFYDDNGTKTAKFVESATDWYFKNHPEESRTDYDYDGDGILDGVMCIYGCPNCEDLENYKAGNLWAYCFWNVDESKRDVNNPGLNQFFWASYDFMYGWEVADRTGTDYYYGDTSNCIIDAHTYIHEMGHIFGLEDYYDYSSNYYTPAGNLTMQDHNVGGHDPYSIMALGWARPFIPKESATITINSFVESGDIILLTNNWNQYDSPFDEYILIELYTPTGVNESDSTFSYFNYGQLPTKTGVRVWHVDSRLAVYKSTTDSWNITMNPNDNNYLHAMTNTYWYDGDDYYNDNYCSPLGKSYTDYNLLQYIRNDTFSTYKPITDSISENNMFYAGSTFSMEKFSKQFKNGTMLNRNVELGWEFKVTSIENEQATIELTRK